MNHLYKVATSVLKGSASEYLRTELKLAALGFKNLSSSPNSLRWSLKIDKKEPGPQSQQKSFCWVETFLAGIKTFKASSGFCRDQPKKRDKPGNKLFQRKTHSFSFSASLFGSRLYLEKWMHDCVGVFINFCYSSSSALAISRNNEQQPVTFLVSNQTDLFRNWKR